MEPHADRRGHRSGGEARRQRPQHPAGGGCRPALEQRPEREVAAPHAVVALDAVQRLLERGERGEVVASGGVDRRAHGGRAADDDAVLDDRVRGAAGADADVDVLVALRPAALTGHPVARGVDVGGRGDVRAVGGRPGEGEGPDAVADPGRDVALAALPADELLQPRAGVGGAEHLAGGGERVVARRARRRDRRLHVHGRACGDDGRGIRGRLLLRAAAGGDRDEEGGEHREAQASGRRGGGHVPRRYRGVRGLRAMHTDRRNRPRGCKFACVRADCTATPGFSGGVPPPRPTVESPANADRDGVAEGVVEGGWWGIGCIESCSVGESGLLSLLRAGLEGLLPPLQAGSPT